MSKTSLETLEQSLQTLKETEDVGKDTVEKLAVQRQQIEKVKEGLKETNSQIKQSHRVLNTLSKR